jgi:hypothetical protein
MATIKNTSHLANITTYILHGIGAIAIITLLFNINEYRILLNAGSGEYVSASQFELNEILHSVSAYFSAFILLLCVPFFLMWFYNAYRNVGIVIPGRTEFHPKMAVWNWFIPFLNLYRPYKMAIELWDDTQRAIANKKADYQIDPKDDFILIWWITFLASGLFGNVLTFLTTRDIWSMNHFLFVSTTKVLATLFAIASAYIAIYFVRKIARAEKELFELYLNKDI